jgi:hypothetical protein
MELNPYEAPKELGHIPPGPIVNTILGMRRGFAIVAAIISLALIGAVFAGCVFVLLANR